MLFFCFLLVGVFSSSILGQTEWGFNDYTKYEPGNMNLIITAPHGGSKRPTKQENEDAWPDRTHGCLQSSGCVWEHNCGVKDATNCRAVTSNDLYTATVARDIADGINSITGFRPHVVYNRLRRTKLDANREINQATLNVPDAIKAYQDYTNFIYRARSAFPGRGLLLDIHGHGHKIQRTELGYLIYGAKLDSGDYDVDDSSIRSLGNLTCGSDNACFKNLIRGNRSLGHFMNLEGLRAVPSPQEPGPMVRETGPYFSGGFTVKEYGSKDKGDIDAIQMEFPGELRRNKTAWEHARVKVARAISEFFMLSYDSGIVVNEV